MDVALPEFIRNPSSDVFLSDNYLVLDLETTNFDYGNPTNNNNSLVLWSAYHGPSGTRKTRRETEYECHELLSLISSVDFVVAHNAKFEMGWLQRAGQDLTKVLCFDTQIAEYVLESNKVAGKKGQLKLSNVSKKYGFGDKDPYIDKAMDAGICPSELPHSFLVRRVEKDVDQTHGVFLKQRERLVQEAKINVFLTRSIFTPALASIEYNGMHLDCARVREATDHYSRELDRVNKQIDKMTGGINPRSGPQVAEFIYETLGFEELKDRRGNPLRTDSGRPKTDADTLVALKAKTKEQREFIKLKREQNKYQHMLSKNLEFFDGVCEEKGGLFHAQFNQTVTKTQRLSSSGLSTKFQKYDKPKSVQFQNLPRIFKSMFSPRHDGWFMGEIDGSQLEFRVAAFLGQDKRAHYDITHGVDVHQFTADTLTDAGQDTDRQGAKAHTFKPLYGGESGTQAEQTYYREFRRKYPGIDQTQQSWINSVIANKKLTLPWGMEFHWPDTKMLKSGYVVNKESICNYPVQNLATAEIIPVAVTYLWHYMQAHEMESFLVNTVHDSAIAEIHPNERELFCDLAVKAFTSAVYEYLERVYGIRFNIPLAAEIKLGSHWNEGDEFNYEPECPFEFAA